MLQKVSEGSEDSLTFWGILRNSHWFFSDSEYVVKVLRRSTTFWNILRHFEVFSLVLSGSEMCLTVLSCSRTLWGFCGILKPAHGFLVVKQVSEGSEAFAYVLGC